MEDKDKVYFELLEYARQSHDASEEIERMKNDCLYLASKKNYKSAKELSREIKIKRKCRAKVIEEFSELFIEHRDKLTNRERDRLEDYAFHRGRYD